MMDLIENYEISFNKTGVLITFDRLFSKENKAVAATVLLNQLTRKLSLAGGQHGVEFISPLSSQEVELLLAAETILVSEFDNSTEVLRQYEALSVKVY